MDRHPRAGGPVVASVPAPGTVLCRLDELPNPGGRGFTFGDLPHPFGMFVVRQGDAVFAYANDCPHTHSPLDWVPDQFLDYSRTHIQCATHGAKFRIQDGYCLSGPCKGEALTPISVQILDGEVVVAGS